MSNQNLSHDFSEDSSENRLDGDDPSQLNKFQSLEVQSIMFSHHKQQSLEYKLNKTLLVADELQKMEKYDEALLKIKLVLEKINYLKIQKRDYDKKLQIVCCYNLAHLYQKKWNLDECVFWLQKFIAICRLHEKELSLSNSVSGNALNNNIHSHNKFWFKLKTASIRGMLQFCAVLSQIGEFFSHTKAMKVASDTSKEIKTLFKKGYEECSKILKKQQGHLKKKLSFQTSEYSTAYLSTPSLSKVPSLTKLHTISDKIEFSTSVLTQSINILEDLQTIQTYHEIIESSNYEETKKQLLEIKSKTYFWKNNPENNIKMLRKQFSGPTNSSQLIKSNPFLKEKQEINSQKFMKTNQLNTMKNINGSGCPPLERNLLGIKKNINWLEEYTIAKVMYINPLQYLQLVEEDNIIYEFNYKNIIEKIILLSVAYFSLSIQLRFLQNNHQDDSMNDKGQKNKNKGKGKEKELNSRLNEEVKKEQQLLKSQIFHLKSLEIICKHVKQNCAFINHLVHNYHKYYQNLLNIIEEENSIAEYSELYDLKRSRLHQEEHQIQKQMLDKECLSVQPNQGYRRDSIYFNDQMEDLPNKNVAERKKIEQIKKYKKQKQQSLERSKKFNGSNSFSRQEIQQFNKDLKDKTMKKQGFSKVITIGKNSFRELTERNDKSQSNSKKLLRSLDKKSFSIKNNLKNSITLAQHKSKSPQKSRQSPQKNRQNAKKGINIESSNRQFQLIDLKDSYQFKRGDFQKKKSPEATIHPNRDLHKYQKKGNSKALDLLKKSGSSPNMKILIAEHHKLEKEITPSEIYSGQSNTNKLKAKKEASKRLNIK